MKRGIIPASVAFFWSKGLFAMVEDGIIIINWKKKKEENGGLIHVIENQ